MHNDIANEGIIFIHHAYNMSLSNCIATIRHTFPSNSIKIRKHCIFHKNGWLIADSITQSCSPFPIYPVSCFVFRLFFKKLHKFVFDAAQICCIRTGHPSFLIHLFSFITIRTKDERTTLFVLEESWSYIICFPKPKQTKPLCTQN